MTKRLTIVVSVLLLAAAWTFGQDSEPENLNLYYRYPLAFGADFHSWNSFVDYGEPYNIYEFGGSIRYPIPRQPLLQPMLRGSYIRFDSLDEANPAQWDHTHIFGGAGIAVINRLARNFEVGGEFVFGYSRTSFPNIAAEPVGYGNLIAALTPRITLVPSFNLAINVEPTIRYSYGLGEVDKYNGFTFSVGIGAEFRLGQDPDSAGAEIRSLNISQPVVGDVFAAMQSYYVNNPIGTVSIQNTENYALEDVHVSFFQNSYMDSPTPSERIERLEPGEIREVSLLASFNSEVFTTEGITPLTGEVVVTYTSRGRPGEQRESVTYDLHDKTALTWNDDRKMGSFITASDSAIRNYMSFVHQAGEDAILDSISEQFQVAMLAYHALDELGVVYQVDPVLSFTQVQTNYDVIDSVNLPRNTLVRLAGDCDDLTALYATMLESVGIETAFITTPGHIYVAFNTQVPARDYMIIHPDRAMTLTVGDHVWVPVEVTMLGNGNFIDAWRYGISEWDRYESNLDERSLYVTREAQNVYRPVGLRETDLGLQYGSATRIENAFQEDFETYAETVLESARQVSRDRRTKSAYNRLGIYAARLGRYDEALQAFQRASGMDSTYLDPLVNLGSVYYLQGHYAQAIRAFQDAANALELADGGTGGLAATIYINLSKAQFALGQYDDAEESYSVAAQVDPEGVAEFAYLAQPGGARASEAASGPPILFADETPEE
jgi:hypothetical protein